ncbi:alpha-hydroxy-acid oxidizing protein [Acetobacter senegalensis]|uniref:alpha-hydroxy acid oxidase n=1 Tax=Acetobacter senegalensis TaxID=446692 RepID=UPI00209CB4CF|nr:alpha-hydroxy acid oxidase [Acetobacter senegalensis]MCP1196494.1 alpha-hydroxy-acid oxidizing protein [Acetobacter senegalensis]
MVFTGIDNVQQKAEHVLPRLFRDYVAGGAHEESTMRRNRQAFGKWSIIPRCLQDVSQVSTHTRCLDYECSAPFMLAPVGFAGMMRRGADLMAARAAAAEQIPFCVSTFSIAALEDVCKVPDVDILAQLYVFRDRAITHDMMRRARNCGVRTLILTVDTAITPLRPRDERNGFRRLAKPSLTQMLSFASAWRWSLNILRYKQPELGNLKMYGMGRSLLEQAKNAAAQIDPSLSWTDLDWLRKEWKGNLVVKGIMHPEDANRCVEAGVDAVMVSNHGGRQLDPAPATLDVLPDIVAASGNTKHTVILDSGVRRGGDVVTALAQGASMVALGRPWAWALAANGEQELREMIAGLRGEVRDVMALAGINGVSSLRENGSTILRQA